LKAGRTLVATGGDLKAGKSGSQGRFLDKPGGIF